MRSSATLRAPACSPSMASTGWPMTCDCVTQKYEVAPALTNKSRPSGEAALIITGNVSMTCVRRSKESRIARSRDRSECSSRRSRLSARSASIN